MAKAKILIVDDDLDLIEGTKAILESADYLVSSAVNKHEGLKEIKDNRPDLIILDVHMTTSQEGFELNLELRKNPDYANIPVLLQTGIEIMSSSHSVADMIREMRNDVNFKDNLVLLVHDISDGTIGVDYLSEGGGSIFLPVDGFLRKPVDHKNLLNEIEKLLNK
jgi:CheY-like chemotaxis protein